MWASHFVRNGNKLSISSWLASEVHVCQNVGRPNPRLPNLFHSYLHKYFPLKIHDIILNIIIIIYIILFHDIIIQRSGVQPFERLSSQFRTPVKIREYHGNMVTTGLRESSVGPYYSEEI